MKSYFIDTTKENAPTGFFSTYEAAKTACDKCGIDYSLIKEVLKQWIVSEPFNRRQYASMTNSRVDYSGYLYNNGGENMTFEEYMSCPERMDKFVNPRIVSDDEFFALIEQSENDMKTGFSEVTQKQYWEALECLPPMRWRDIAEGLNVFFISEATTGLLHSCYLADKKTGKYYSALRSKLETNEELLNIYKTSVK